MYELLRSVWNEPRPSRPPSRTWWDWALVGVLVPVAVLEGALRPDLPWRSVAVAVTVGLVPTLLWRRTRPLLMVAIAFGVTGLAPLLAGGQAPETYTSVYMLLLPYALFRWGTGREAVIGSAVVLAKACLAAVLGNLGPADTIGGLAFLLSVSALGAALRYRGKARTRELEQVRLLERERLARDLHDTVTHHVSAVAVRAQAGLAVSASRPEAAAEALGVIESEASRALTEMRTMVRVLRRDHPAELAPNPCVGDLEQLASRSRTGPSVVVEVVGDLHGLPPSVGTAIYRLAQESVTNARRHARNATRIEVRVAADDESVRLRVSDDGELSPLRPSAVPGYGILGMAERADLLGGTCEAAPNHDRGWTVTAVLPRTGSAG
ncbi:sensor histidine kinase [Nocardiopsis deserti]|uniref:sensor histidine kinase n=1 Tax=Nocardiopsis deserti TaxID=2605988 RepID=UPI00123A2861|nr:sensor histidine kinase [Nocardiopsis deserti]